MDKDQILDYDLGSDSNKTKVELISTNKFIVLCLVTFGLYVIWWMYKSWKFFKEKDKLAVMPVMRAIFSIFFAYSLFERILNYAKSNGYTKEYSSTGLFVLFIVLNLMSRLPDPYSLVSLLSVFCFIQPFNALSYAIHNSDSYNGVERDGFNARQIVLLVLGGILCALVLVGLFMPTEEVYY